MLSQLMGFQTPNGWQTVQPQAGIAASGGAALPQLQAGAVQLPMLSPVGQSSGTGNQNDQFNLAQQLGSQFQQPTGFQAYLSSLAAMGRPQTSQGQQPQIPNANQFSQVQQ